MSFKNEKIEKLLKLPDKEQFEKDFEALAKKNILLVKEGNKSQIPSNETLLRRFTI